MRKTILLVSTALMLALAACGNQVADSGSPADQTTATETENAGSVTSNAESMPFKAVMDNMMRDMHSMTMTQDPDHDFAMMMKAHHQGAIEMSNIELAQGKSEELKQVAQKIITDSQQDINELDAFLTSHQPQGTSDFAQKAMDIMMKGGSPAGMDHGADVDQQFATMMAMHHQHGIDMAREYLKSGKAEETKKVADNTIRTNSEDLTVLQNHQHGH